MKSVVICIIAMLVCASAVKLTLQDKYPLNFSPKRSMMTLLTQIEARMKAGGPLDAITKMLDDFKNEINNEQVSHDGLWARQQVECSGEQAFRQEEINEAVGALKAAQETFDGCSAQRVRADGDLSISKSQLNEARNFLVQITTTRSQQQAYFEQQQSKFQDAIKVVEEAIVILQELYNGEASFVQIAKHSNKLLKHTAGLNKARLLGPLMAALAQLGSQNEQTLDVNVVDRVKTLLVSLREKLQGQFNEQVQAEQESVAAFNEEQSRIQSVIANLEQTVQDLEVELAQLDKCIVTQSGIVSSATAKRDRNTQLLNDADSLCEAVKVQYEQATKSRQQELQLLAAIRERVEARFAQLATGVVQRGQQDEFNYENQSAYDHPEFAPSQ